MFGLEELILATHKKKVIYEANCIFQKFSFTHRLKFSTHFIFFLLCYIHNFVHTVNLRIDVLNCSMLWSGNFLQCLPLGFLSSWGPLYLPSIPCTTNICTCIGTQLLGFLNSAAAAAAKSLQSCPTLCDPIDSGPPGSAIPGIL